MKPPAASWAVPLSCTVLFYGLAGGLWKDADLSAAQFCLLMVLVKSVLNWGVWAATRPAIRPNAFMRWTLLGQLFNGVAWICYFQALAGGPAALVQTLTAAYTALAALLAVVFLRERLVAVQAVGVLLTVVATALISGVGGDSVAGSPWFAYCMGTLVCWAVSVICFKHAYNQPDASDSVFFIGNWIGMVLTLLPYALLQGAPLPALGLGTVIVLLYAVGDLTLFAAIARGPAAIVSPLSGLYPVPTLIYAAAIQHAPITGVQWLATFMVLVAIVLVVPAAENPVRLWLSRKESA